MTLTVNLRFFLMSMTLRPWFGGLPAWQAYPILFFVTDVGWLRAMRYRAEGGSDVGSFSVADYFFTRSGSPPPLPAFCSRIG